MEANEWMQNGDAASQKDGVPNGVPKPRQELAAEANVVGYGK